MSFEIPNYTLLSKLGEGAMAEVWLAEHKINRRKAAIKILKPAALSDTNAEKLFVREGEVLASFDHPNIVRILEHGHSGNLSYLVMECLLGGTLLQRMDPASPPITVGEALGLTVQIAGGLEAAHQQQVVHRDLKPANIMLRNDTTPVLTDFGIARFLDRSVSLHSEMQMIVGTVAYMSPEQVTGRELDGHSNLYALGILFFELLTGRRPFPGRGFHELALQHLHAPLPQLPAELSVLQPVLDQLLAKQKEDRYPTAQAFIDALRACFVSEIALRRQVGFAASSRAWSSQLRALGFVLDVPQVVEARIVQGEFLQNAAVSNAKSEEPAPAAGTPPANLARAAGALLRVSVAPQSRLALPEAAVPAPVVHSVPWPEPAPLVASRVILCEGEIFERYRLGPLIGRGGMAFVFALDQHTCIKIGYAHGGGSASVTRALVAEDADERCPGGAVRADEDCADAVFFHTGSTSVGALTAEQIVAVLAHEAQMLQSTPAGLLPRLHASGVWEGLAYIVMERIDGPTLRERLRAGGGRDPKLVPALAGLAHELLRAAEQAPGFFHGDLKPENLIVTASGLRMLDPAFRDRNGLMATLTTAYNPLALTGVRADTQALALIAFEALSGERPFHGYLEPLLGSSHFVSAEVRVAQVLEFLDLARFDRYRGDPLLARLLDWIGQPPALLELSQGLGLPKSE